MRPRDPRFEDASGSFDMDGFTMLGPSSFPLYIL